MPELNFLFAKEDEAKLISYAIESLNLFLVPSIYYESEQYIKITNVNSFEKYRDFSTTFYLLSEQERFLGFKMGKMDEGPHSGKYFICQRYGGPSIDLHFRNIVKKEEQFVVSGFISYYPRYINIISREEEKAPEFLKNIYNILTSYIKRNGKLFKTTAGTKAWAGERAYELYLNGDLKFKFGEQYFSPAG